MLGKIVEIIEFNCFRLSDNTRKNIMKREKIEDLSTIRESFVDENEENRTSSIRMEMNDDDNSLLTK